MQRVKLVSNRHDRDQQDNLADLFSIITTVERLERAWVRDATCTPAIYESACASLIAKFRTQRSVLAGLVPDIEQFGQAYQLDCPRALHRLLRSGVPATIEHNALTGVTVRNTRAVQETVQAFITAMDALKLEMNAVDQLQPYLVDVVATLQRAPGVSPAFEHLDKLKQWLSEN